jgi:branched-chain amino acid transport system permease protein
VASNRELAQCVGIDPERIHVLVFAIGSTLAGLAGALLALRDTASPTMGVQPVLTAFIAVFLGGIGSILGAVVGGLVLGLAENMGSALGTGRAIAVVLSSSPARAACWACGRGRARAPWTSGSTSST